MVALCYTVIFFDGGLPNSAQTFLLEKHAIEYAERLAEYYNIPRDGTSYYWFDEILQLEIFLMPNEISEL